MSVRRASYAALGVCLALVTIVWAQPTPDPEHVPTALARIESGNRLCSGTLIAPDTVLTAAHCLDAVAMDALVVRFGDVSRGVRRWYAASERTESVEGAGLIAKDVALLHLDRAVPRAVAAPLRLHPATRRGMEVRVFPAEAAPSAPCTLLRGYRDGVLEFDCLVGQGASGAPVLARFGDHWRVLSLISALAVNEEGTQRAYGMVLGAQVSALQAQLHQSRVRERAATGARHVGAGDRGGLGDRFVKP